MSLKDQLKPLEDVFGLKFKINGNNFEYEIPSNFDFNENKNINLRQLNLLNYLIIYYESLFADFSTKSVDKLITDVFYKSDVNILDDKGNNVMMNEVLSMKEDINSLADEHYEFLLKNTNLFNTNKSGKTYFDLLIERNNGLMKEEVDFLLTQDINKKFDSSNKSLADVMLKITDLTQELTAQQELKFVEKIDKKNYNVVLHFLSSQNHNETKEYLLKNANFNLLNKEKDYLLSVDVFNNGKISDKELNELLKNNKINFSSTNSVGNFTQNLNKLNTPITVDNFEIISKYDPANAYLLADQLKDAGVLKKFVLMIKNYFNKNNSAQIQKEEEVNYLDDLSFIKGIKLKKKVLEIKEDLSFFIKAKEEKLLSQSVDNEVLDLNKKVQRILKNCKLHNSAEIEEQSLEALETIADTLYGLRENLKDKSSAEISVMKKSM